MPNQKHLNAVTRKLIQDGLDQGLSMAEIARQIDKSKSTVSREVKTHISFQPCLKESDSNGKAVIWDCVCIHECSPDNGICKSPCKKRKPIPCEFRDKKGLCNGCPKAHRPRRCKLEKRLYKAKQAQEEYEETLRESRTGINLTGEEFQYVKRIISEGVKNGQSLSPICQRCPEIPVTERTVYTWIEHRELADQGVLNIDLPLKVKREIRFKPSIKTKKRKDNSVVRGRTYEDFQKHLASHPGVSVVEMDTVYNDVTNGPFMQTFLFRDPHHLFLAVYHTEKTAQAMYEGLKTLHDQLGAQTFRRLFAVILTDRGSEFTAVEEIEALGVKVFYCDPMQSIQKTSVENKHLLLRRIFLKNRGSHIFDLVKLGRTSQEQLNIAVSHINSYGLKSLHGHTPYDYFCFLEKSSEILEKLGIKKIDPASVHLKPDLLTR